MTERIDIRVLRALASLAGERPYNDECGVQLYGIGVELWNDIDGSLKLPISESSHGGGAYIGLVEPARRYLHGKPNVPLEGDAYESALNAFADAVGETLGWSRVETHLMMQRIEEWIQ